MATEYRKFRLSPGQQAPNGSSGVGTPDGYIVWVGEENTFPTEIESALMTEAEILKFEKRNAIQLTQLEFRNRFTLDELVAIEVAAASDPILRVLKDNQALANWIDVTDPQTIQGVQYLVSQNLLTAERAAAILTL